MTIGRFRESSAMAKRAHKRREEARRRRSKRNLRIESLEQRQLLATGPQLVGIQPNRGDLLADGDIRNVAPRELVFRFDEAAVIDEATLGAITVTRSGGDGQFSTAKARTDFNTAGQVVVEFRAAAPGSAGNDVSLIFSRRNVGLASLPAVTVEGRTIFVELNTTPGKQTTAQQLVNAINATPRARDLVQAVVISGPTSTNIAASSVTYSPLQLRGGNQASVSSNFNSGTNLDIAFTATAAGAAGNGIQIEVSKVNRGGVGSPTITVNGRTIKIALNSNPGNETTAGELVSVFNANPLVRALAVASHRTGSAATKIGLASVPINYSPLVLGGANDVALTPGYVGLGDSPRDVIFRFAETLPNDQYRIDIAGTGSAPLRSKNGFALGDTTDDGRDNGRDFSRVFSLDLGPQVVAVVPQPITRNSAGVLTQSTSQIEVYFNDDDLSPVHATNPSFYQLIFTNDTVQTTDDVVYKPIAVQYSAESDRALLTFSRPLHQLGSGAGTFRLRIGTDEAPLAPPTRVDLRGHDAGSSFDTAYSLGSLNGSLIVSAAIDPQVFNLALPGASDEPGHRNIPDYLQSHLSEPADSENGIATIFYNFRSDYGTDPSGNKLSNLINDAQKARAREAFELWGRAIGAQFVETVSQGIVVATGDLRAVNPLVSTGQGGIQGVAGFHPVTDQPTVILDGAENWYEAFGASDDPLRPYSWFESAMTVIGLMLGVGETDDLPPGTVTGSDSALAFDNLDFPEPIYPGDHDIVHGRHLYRNEGQDIDLYRVDIAQAGTLSIETMAQRLADASLLDTVVAVYREENGRRELIGRNDDYFSQDSFIELPVTPGVYYVGVSAAGNTDYNPSVEGTGFGGVSEGRYELRLTVRADVANSLIDADNAFNTDASLVSQRTALDGDGDGEPGGVYNFWFRASATPIIVDKSAPSGGSGTLSSPFNTIAAALQASRSGDIVRIVGNGGTDGNLGTAADAMPYEIGFNLMGLPLRDGSTLDVPKGVTVMIDRGAVVKLRRARIGVGSYAATTDLSGGALQVLGTPHLVDAGGFVVRDASGNPLSGRVVFTSHNDESLGGDSTPGIATSPAAGDWGGLLFRRDLDQSAGRLDRENAGIFLNYVGQADIRYGGGVVTVGTVPQTVSPVHMIDARPMVTFNSITYSADAAMAASPNSFEETNFHAPRFQAVPFTSDYTRVGPVIYGNRIVNNSINGLFIQVSTPAGRQTQKLTVSGRWNATDVVYVLAENLRIAGNAGGPLQTITAPKTGSVTLTRQTPATDGGVPAGSQRYKLTFVAADGRESPSSDPTAEILVHVTDVDSGRTQNVLLQNLPAAPAGYVGRRLYRSEKAEFVLVAELDAASTSYLDTGRVLGGLLADTPWALQGRLAGGLVIDPGVTVKFNGAGIETGFGAHLIAEGLDGAPVVFTAIQDNRYGAGGTFTTSDRGELTRGAWTGLYAGPASQISLDHARLAYGGGVSKVPGNFASFNVLEIQQAEARVANSVFEHNGDGMGGQATAARGGRGSNAPATIFVRGAQPVVIDNAMSDNRGAAISIDVNSLNHELVTDPGRATGAIDRRSEIVANAGPLIRGNRLGGNELNGMSVRGGTLTTEGIWDDTDIVHIVQDQTIYVPDFHTYGGLRLESSATQSLVIKFEGERAGFTATGRPLEITDRIGGALYVLGQPGHPVVMTSLNDCTVGAGFTPSGNPQVETKQGACGVPDRPGAGGLGPLEIEKATNDANELRNALLGPGITPVGNATLIGGERSAGIFRNGLASIGIDSGVILATGDIDVAAGPNVNDSDSGLASGQGDPDLDAAFGRVPGSATATQDTTSLEFRFRLDPGAAQNLFFNFVFASEEYNEQVNDPNHDVFAFFLDGVNLAVLPGTTTPISSNTVNGAPPSGAEPGNPQFYRNNSIVDNGSYLNLFGYDGFTSVFTAQALGIGPGVHTIKLAISDVGDRDVDSAVFLQWGSFSHGALGSPPQPGDWRSVQFLADAHDRNVDTAVEWETGDATVSGTNDAPTSAQYLGMLAPHEKAADDNRRLGLEVGGALNRPGDLDVYAFQADAGTEVWLDIDRTSHGLDTVLELIDGSGGVLARSDDSARESQDPSLLYRNPALVDALTVSPLSKSVVDGQDRWTTNPLDAGMRVVLPGPPGSTNTYYVRVRSSSARLGDLNAGLTTGVYRLQIRLRELDEIPGSTVRMADIRYASTGIEVIGGPRHSPLTGEAAEAVDGQGNDGNGNRSTADNLGNLFNSDRGAISVAGALANAGDVDWYQFDVRYDAMKPTNPNAAQSASLVVDVDYADGFARANTSLWVFDSQGRLILVGGDSDTLDDRPATSSDLASDLSRGSVGVLDPFIGPVQVPAATGLTTGRYYVAVSSSARIPEELQQFLTPSPINPLVRLEPINSINRIAEDRIGASGTYATAQAPTIPVLFGASDQVTLFIPAGNGLTDGEAFTITNAAGGAMTYEFDADGSVRPGNVPIPFFYDDTSDMMGRLTAQAISLFPPPSLTLGDVLPDPTASAPVVVSELTIGSGAGGQLVLQERVTTRTLLNEVAQTDPLTGLIELMPLTRQTTRVQEPHVRQVLAPGEADTAVFVSRPAVADYRLGDVTLFVTQQGQVNRSELLSVDAFTGATESRIGAFGAAVGDIAMHPQGALPAVGNAGGLFGFSIPQTGPQNDKTSAIYWQVNPGLNTPATLGEAVGDSGIETWEEDPTKAGTAIRAGNGKDGVGIRFNAVTFSGQSQSLGANVRGFAVGNRGDVFIDPVTGQTFSGALRIPSPANILFEFDPSTGEALNPQGVADRDKNQLVSAGGTQIWERGLLNTNMDRFPAGGTNTTVTGIDATSVTLSAAGNLVTQVNIEDEDFFFVDRDGNGTGDQGFEFDSGPEFRITVSSANAANPLVPQDGDTFTVDGVPFQFDTGSVIVVTAQNGGQLVDGAVLTLTDNAATPQTVTFEFDNDNDAGGNIPIPFNQTSNQQAIISAIMAAIAGVPNFGVQAVQLPGTNRLTLIGESATAGATTDAAGIAIVGQPGVTGGAIAVPVEETFSAAEVGAAIAAAVNADPGVAFWAGAAGNRLNFAGALDADFSNIRNPGIFFQTGQAGTRLPLVLPIPFLVSDTAADIADRVHMGLAGANLSVSQTGTTVLLTPPPPPSAQPRFVCVSLGTPPQIGAPGIPDCPLPTGGAAPGGNITGIAFVGPQLYAVTDTGGLFRIANAAGDAFAAGSRGNVADYIDGSRELLQAVNDVVSVDLVYHTPLTFSNTNPDTIIDVNNGFVDAGFVIGGTLVVSGTQANDGEYTITQVSPGTITLAGSNTLTTETVLDGARLQMKTTMPVRFAGLVSGPSNAENGRYENLLFGITDMGRIFAFDTWGRPQAVFANAQYYVDSGVFGANGLAFSILDDNLWHMTTRRDTAPGHNVSASFDDSRLTPQPTGNRSLYFGYERPQVQPQFGTAGFAPNVTANTYDFPGGAQGTLLSNPFSLEGYAASDKPTLYFDYWLDTERADDNGSTALVQPDDRMRDALRVYVSGDDGRWKLLSTNNSDRNTTTATDGVDEFHPFMTTDPQTGRRVPEQPFQRVDLFDSLDPQANDPWRQARVDLSPYAGQKNLRLRFEFSTAGGLSTGGRMVALDLNTAGNELRALAGAELRDGQQFTLTDIVRNPLTNALERVEVVGFEFDFGPTIVAPTGAAVSDGALFDVDGTIYEFDNNGIVGITNSIPHIAVAFSGAETGAELASAIQRVLEANPPTPLILQANLIQHEMDVGQNDTLTAAFRSGLDGTTQTLQGTGFIGDNYGLGANVPFDLDVDLVSLRLDAGDRLVIQTDTRAATQLDPYLRLFDANGVELAANDNLDPTNPFSRDARIEFTASQRGTYYVGISAAHNPNYDPSRMGSGVAVPGVAVTQGSYEFTITVSDPAGLQRIGNRLNLPNAGSVTTVGLPPEFVDGRAGVASGLANPLAGGVPGLPDLPVVPVRVTLAMTALDVADAIRTSLAAQLGNGNVEAIKARHETVQIIGYGVGDPGPLGLSGPSDPTTSVPNSGLFGDLFGAFGTTALFNGQTAATAPGALGMRDNQHEGVFIDNIVIGFASRGEMVTGSAPTADPQFVVNAQRSPTDIVRGEYQLEVRQATEYGMAGGTARPGLLLYQGFDVNDRLADGLTITAAPGYQYRDGQTFTLSDGTASVVFEFQDKTLVGGVADGNAAIVFDPGDSQVVMARRIRDAVNAMADAGQLAVRAASSDGVLAGRDSTSGRVHLIGPARITDGASSGASTSQSFAAEGNDTLDGAIDTGLRPGGREGYRAGGVIGDNPAVRPFGAEIDLFRVELAAGETITIDIDASELGSPLDSVLRVFDSTGAPVLVPDYQWRPQPLTSDDDLAPGESDILWSPVRTNLDSYLVFTAPADGVYYLGVSGFGNEQYDPRTMGVGSSSPADLTVYNGELYFSAYTPASGRELWKLNAAGQPELVVDLYPGGSSNPADLLVFNNELFFTAYLPGIGRELWKIDSLGDVRLVADVYADGSSDPSDLTVFNNSLYFSAYTPASGRELWRTTAGGVVTQVADIDPFGSSSPADFVVFNNDLYFSATSPTTGRELWKVNAAGVVTNVADLESNGSSDPSGLTEFNGNLYFAATTTVLGRELWRVNTLGGVSPATDINPAGSSDPSDLRVFNNRLYFAATAPGSGRELWRLDASGSVALAAEINPAGSSDPAGLTVFNNELYFSAAGPTGGRELWKLNAAETARQVIDLEPGGSSDPGDFRAMGDGLYFSAFTTTSGRELWRLAAGGAVSPVADLDQSHRLAGSTGFYEIEILRPWVNNGVRTEQYSRRGDANLFRDQGQLVIRDTFVSDSAGYGISVQAAPRTATGAAVPGPARNLATVNTARLAPGVTITNNVLAYNRTGGIHFSGDRGDSANGPLQPATVPFGRVLNNTIYGGDRDAVQLIPADIVFVVDTTGSMADDIGLIRQRIDQFDASLRFAGIDPHYGLVTFPGNAPAPIQIQDMTDFATFTAPDSPFRTFQVPAGGSKEYGSLALREALNDVNRNTTFNFRPGVQVVTVLFTDEEDDSSAADFNAALEAFDARSAIFFGVALNPDLPNDIDSATNNTDARYGELARRTGGRLFDIAGFANDPRPLFDGVVDVLTGLLAQPGTTGIAVENNASPTLLNNVVVGLETGIRVDASSATTVIGGTVYQDNQTNATGIGAESFPLQIPSTVAMFRDPLFGNFYPSPNSPLIDSSIDALEDRLAMTQVSGPLGIAPSPIITPKFDASGQLRVDDPAVAPPPGLGENVFKDRGALDRADFVRPHASLVLPLDNGAGDLDPALSRVHLAHTALDRFSIQLADGQAPLFGSGIDTLTVSTGMVSIMQDNRELVRGVDFTVWYDSTSNILHIVPLAGVWQVDSNYVIRLQNRDQHLIEARSGDQIADGDRFRITDEFGNAYTFEYDTGYVLTVPQSYAIQVPVQGGAAGGVADGDTVTVDVSVTDAFGTVTTYSVTLEFDNNSVLADPDHLPITFTAASTQGEIADALVAGLRNAAVGLRPANVGQGRVYLGVDGTQTASVDSATLALSGGPIGVLDGDTFTIDNGSRLFVFQFTTSGVAGSGRIPVRFAPSQTDSQIAQAIAAAVNGQPVGMVARTFGDGRVQLGGEINHRVDISESHLALAGKPGVRLPFGIRIPTSAGRFQGLLHDGETFVITDSTGRSVTFELDDNNLLTPGNVRIPFTASTTTQQLADTLAIRIRDAGLGLWPFNMGNGIVALGGEGYTVEVGEGGLTQVGVSGLPGAIPIQITAAASFSAANVAIVTAGAINSRSLPGINATVDSQTSEVIVNGVGSLAGDGVRFRGSAKDMSGNPLGPNQANGETRFSIFIGEGMDYGNAPDPYPTLREQDGARHVIINGFSLGPTVNISADGLPTTSDGRDIPGNDGVSFDAATPLIPGRTFNVTVSTSGITNDVLPAGKVAVLSAWIDFNRDGDWRDPGEQILSNVVLPKTALDANGQITFRNLPVPTWAVPGDTYVRFRLSTESGMTPTGEAQGGEVEDYRVTIQRNPWQNPVNRFDVNNDGGVSPVDALLLINYVNANPGASNTPLPAVKPSGDPFYDVNGDGFATPADVLAVINELNRLNNFGVAEGEFASARPAVSDSHLGDVLRGDESWLEMLEDVDRSLSARSAVDHAFADLRL